MHAYERKILQVLTLRGEARYRDLKPEKAESNLFVYHLKKLGKEGMIKKEGTTYTLTAAGKRYVDKLSLANFEPRFQPKIVTVIICQNTKGSYLVCTRKREPFYGMKAFPYGKVHFGETVQEAATRELREKTGISATLRHCGEMYLTVHKNGELLTYMLAHVFAGKNPKGTLQNPESGECEWNAIHPGDRENFIPGFIDMMNLAKKKGRFFEEKEFFM